MITIEQFLIDSSNGNIAIDNKTPTFSFSLKSDRNDTYLKKATISLNGWKVETDQQINITYDGEELKPTRKYRVNLEVIDNYDNKAQAYLDFETGLMEKGFKAKFISDPLYHFKEKRVSPKVLTFRKNLALKKKIKEAKIYSTALGIYDIFIDNKQVFSRYFAPGFTSYKHTLQYQVNDVSNLLNDNSTIYVRVAGGWAVGSFVFTRKNRISAPRQALLLEIHITYEDGSSEIITNDESFEVASESNILMADFYDGEVFDANIKLDELNYHKACIEKVKIKPNLIAEIGSPVLKHEKLTPTFINKVDDKLIFDFKQNFAGIVSFKAKNCTKNQKIVIRHAEVLKPNGDLNTTILRSAKCEIVYFAKEGENAYEPTFTYMGFRYISIEGIDLKDIEVIGYALYSNVKQIGSFKCDNELINRLNENIIWSTKSNFMDIPTDCPQRDERMGWTGDIALFSPTALFNFESTRFLTKWLNDCKSEQNFIGGIPNTVPHQGYGFPTTMPPLPIDFWGDAIVLVPYALYKATGNTIVLSKFYDSMKHYVNASLRQAKLFGIGKGRYLWHDLNMLHFGDWVAADADKMSIWQGRHKWTATASLKNISHTLSKIAHVLNKKDDEIFYDKIQEKVSDAYISLLTDGKGKLKNEFQTGYVLPIYFDIFKGREKLEAAKNLVKLVKKNDYCIGTGFPGTPYILFALADNGFKEDALKMLLNTKCPSWLYEVKVGGTTIWERWDGLNENGECEVKNDGTGGMISFNHYASGAVGDFLYKRIAGIEMSEAGYKSIKVEPLVTPFIKSAEASTFTPYGMAKVNWKVIDNKFLIEVEIPVSCSAKIIMPSKNEYVVHSGTHKFIEEIIL